MSQTTFRWSRWEIKQIVLIIFIFVAACIETDIYLPAFPDMMNYFHVSEAVIQGILTWNFIGLCLSSPIYGPMSDVFGRSKPLWIALGFFLAGSLVTAFTEEFRWLIFGRILQGLGSGGCFTLGSAIIFDAFSHQKALRALNKVHVIIPMTMASAPLVGGYLNQNFGFRSNFLAVAGVVILSCLICFAFLTETLPQEKRKKLDFKQLGKDFKRVLTSFHFWQLNLTVSLLFSIYLAFLSISAILFVVEFQIEKKVFPFFQAAVLGGWLVASLSSNFAIQKWGAEKIKKTGVSVLAFSLTGFLFTVFFAPTNPVLLTLFMSIYSFGFNWVQTPYFGEVMNLMPDIRGIVGSLVSSTRLFLTAIVVALVSHFYDKSIYSFAYVLIGIIFVIGPMIWARERRTQEYQDSIVPMVH